MDSPSNFHNAERIGGDCDPSPSAASAKRKPRGCALAVLILIAIPLLADTRGGIVIDIDLSPLITRLARHTAVYRDTCMIGTVGYRYVGEPGTEFTFEGTIYKLPETGFIELIASQNNVKKNEKTDQFGFVTRTLPLPKVEVKHERKTVIPDVPSNFTWTCAEPDKVSGLTVCW